MTRSEAVAILRTADNHTQADALANVTDSELGTYLRARSLGHAPRNEGALREREAAVLAAWDAAQ